MNKNTFLVCSEMSTTHFILESTSVSKYVVLQQAQYNINYYSMSAWMFVARSNFVNELSQSFRCIAVM